MFCSKCGKEINDEAVVCPNCGCATDNYKTQHATSVPTQVHSEDYVVIRKFYEQATTMRNLGIVAAVLMFGIGLVFSIFIWVKSSGLMVPEVKTTNPTELAELEDAKKRLKTAQNLASLPIVGIALSVLIGGMMAMFMSF